MAALFASGWPAPASGRYHSLRAAGDGDGGGRAARRGADASPRSGMAVGGAGRWRLRLVWCRATMVLRRCGRCKPRRRWATIGLSMPAACWWEPCLPVALPGRRSAPSRSCVRRCLSIPRRSRWPVVWRCARRIVDVSGQLSALAPARAIGDAPISGWACCCCR